MIAASLLLLSNITTTSERYVCIYICMASTAISATTTYSDLTVIDAAKCIVLSSLTVA
jgi:hypothetical protein